MAKPKQLESKSKATMNAPMSAFTFQCRTKMIKSGPSLLTFYPWLFTLWLLWLTFAGRIGRKTWCKKSKVACFSTFHFSLLYSNRDDLNTQRGGKKWIGVVVVFVVLLLLLLLLFEQLLLLLLTGDVFPACNFVLINTDLQPKDLVHRLSLRRGMSVLLTYCFWKTKKNLYCELNNISQNTRGLLLAGWPQQARPILNTFTPKRT